MGLSSTLADPALAALSNRFFAPPEKSSPQLIKPRGATEALPAQADRVDLASRRETASLTKVTYEARGKFTAGQLSLSRDGDDETASVGFKQLEFEFTAELRALSLSRFNERTQAVEEDLEGPRQTRFAEQRQAVALRFDVSISISAAALEGFASAAEGAQNDENALDRLLQLTERLQEKTDELFNETLSLLNDFFRGDTSATDFADSLNALFDDLFAEFFGAQGAPQLPADGAPTGGVASFAQLEFEFSFSATSITVSTEEEVKQGDPLVLDLDGDGVELTSYRDGARFDLLGEGRAVNTAFVTGGDAFLALDRNGNGRIDDGTELFGEQNGAANGFEELRKLDSNGDNRIDERDDAFDSLRLFRDNGNGVTERGELLTLRDAGIASIDLNYRDVQLEAAGGNVISQLASYQRVDGSQGTAADALLNYTV